jgi:hypothetical protein
MAHARQRADWRRAASLMAIVAEPNRDKDRRAQPYTADDFDPFASEYEWPDNAEEMTEADKQRMAELFNR